jgi:AcrR family transcriptional regulator
MARIAGSNGPRTAAAIRRASLRLIHRHGFEAMSLRDLAAEVGLQPASLYNHIDSKQALLFGLIQDHLETLLARTAEALAAAAPDPLARLKAFIANHVAYHLERGAEVYAANFELRALEKRNLDAVLALRRRYEDILTTLLEEGAAAGTLRLTEARVTAYAILAMLTGVCSWYKPTGRLDADGLIAVHTDLVLRGVMAGAGKALG